ncbi:unnamed protein product [Effrenium voratum]|uniref:Uncharacterized protein n=1 Tax=Effrenium voratum TaxID=2562239 RepID=A0AA36N183_9DINO|nr:unnamed protein product [Effrenium voratum]
MWGSPWVAFGGSYSGALAAWVRQLYPEAFAAAVASSAPVEAQLKLRRHELSLVNTVPICHYGRSGPTPRPTPRHSLVLEIPLGDVDDGGVFSEKLRQLLSGEPQVCSDEPPEIFWATRPVPMMGNFGKLAQRVSL